MYYKLENRRHVLEGLIRSCDIELNLKQKEPKIFKTPVRSIKAHKKLLEEKLKKIIAAQHLYLEADFSSLRRD